MTLGVFPVGRVHHVGHVESRVQDVRGEPALLEVYTGWINADVAGVGGQLVSIDFASFLPHSGTRVKQYPQELTPDVAVIAEVQTVVHQDDETTCHGIDFATVALETQQQLPADPPPRCLVLRGRFALQDVLVNSMSYQVTLLWPPYDPLPVIDLPAHVGPG
ncbi:MULTISPECIES: hypothetical protein [unclassified Streptomyces]|uniref:hypothetical protein n=1 Tax=unclassified Streptomyces TaxID=2593676 RepID=UPI000DC7B8A4|nr:MULTISPECIES: hypothetical protein [unclassified Streptomyces]AWZ08473.1 hypothetical protein DRB89_32170 [Streptomyces sp. ICC4]AWZ16249.1 hypothetical protein DRB96_32940 [Streptomyces sp. ICC1]